MQRILFLDFDGVLNDHTRMRSGYCTIHSDKVNLLNDILEAVPDLQIVISSAWRYLIHGGHMTLIGFENMLLTYGLMVHGRIHGITRPDLDGDECRSRQILDYVSERFRDESPRFVVLDDLDFPLAELIQTDGKVGLTRDLANQVIARLMASPTEQLQESR